MWAQRQPGQVLPGRQRHSWRRWRTAGVGEVEGGLGGLGVCCSRATFGAGRSHCPVAGRDSGIVYCSDSFASASQNKLIGF